MGTRTYEEHFLLQNFTGEKHCHICGLKFESTSEIWDVEGIVVFDRHPKSTKSAVVVHMHLDCCMRGVPH